VGDELVAGVAQLVGVAVAGELEGVADRRAVDRRQGDGGVAPRAVDAPGAVAAGGTVLGRGRVELLDDREEVGEEPVALYVCLRPSRYRRPS